MTREQDDEEQPLIWEEFYERLIERLCMHGTEDWEQTADVWVDDDNLGTLQQKIYVRSLAMLDPSVVKDLQNLVSDYPGWEIMVAISVSGKDDAWPDMGLTIRLHEIIDGLQRQYFSESYRNFRYEGSRSGTDRD